MQILCLGLDTSAHSGTVPEVRGERIGPQNMTSVRSYYYDYCLINPFVAKKKNNSVSVLGYPT